MPRGGPGLTRGRECDRVSAAAVAQATPRERALAVQDHGGLQDKQETEDA